MTDVGGKTLLLFYSAEQRIASSTSVGVFFSNHATAVK